MQTNGSQRNLSFTKQHKQPIFAKHSIQPNPTELYQNFQGVPQQLQQQQEKAINRSYYERQSATLRSPSYDNKENKVPQINLYSNSMHADIHSPRRNPHQPYIIQTQNQQISQPQSLQKTPTNQQFTSSKKAVQHNPQQQQQSLYHNVNQNHTTSGHSFALFNNNSKKPQSNTFQEANNIFKQQQLSENQKQNIEEIVKNEIKSQIDNFKKQVVQNYEDLLKNSNQNSLNTTEKLDSLKDQILEYKQSVDQMNYSVQDIEQKVQDLSSQEDNTNDENNKQQLEKQITEQIENQLYTKFEQEVEGLRKQQFELNQQLNTQQQTIPSIVQQHISSVQNDLQTKEKDNDKQLLDYVNKMQNQWESRITELFSTLNNRLESIEQDSNTKQNQISDQQINEISSKLYSEFQDCISKYEQQLLMTKAQIDSKLEKSDLEEIKQGYKIKLDQDQTLTKLQQDIEEIQKNQQENQQENEFVQSDFLEKVRKFEEYVQTSLQSLQERVQNFQNDSLQQTPLQETQIDQRIIDLEYKLSEMSKQYQKVQDNITTYIDQNNQYYQKVSDSNINNKEKNNTDNNNKDQSEWSDSRLQCLENNLKNLDNKFQNISSQFTNQFQNFNNQLQSHQELQQTQYKAVQENLQQYNKELLSTLQQSNSQSQLLQNSPAYSNQLHKSGVNPQNVEENLKNSTLVSQKFEDYMKKYEEFNKEVNCYLQGKQKELQDEEENIVESQFNGQQIQQQQLQSTQITENKQFDNNPLNNNNNNNFSNTKYQIGNQIISPVKIQPIVNLPTSTGKKSCHTNNMSIINEGENEDEIVYQLDENGYLLGDNGEHICDDEGNWIQLSNEHIEYLKGANILDESMQNLSMQSYKK